VTKAGRDENGNRAEGRSGGSGEDGDEDGGKHMEIPNIYSSKMNK
jgi:hypothetical protein